MTSKRPESVLVIIATAAGEVLLLRRKSPPDYWQSVTGSLEWGETAVAAARRELHEETGLIAVPEDTGIMNDFEIVPPWTEKFAPGTQTNREYVYLLRLPHRTAIILNPEEHLEYRWLSARDALALANSATDRNAIETFVLRPHSR